MNALIVYYDASIDFIKNFKHHPNDWQCVRNSLENAMKIPIAIYLDAINVVAIDGNGLPPVLFQAMY